MLMVTACTRQMSRTILTKWPRNPEFPMNNINEIDIVVLAREFDACGECRLEIGGPKKYMTLSDDEILIVVDALKKYAVSVEMCADCS